MLRNTILLGCLTLLFPVCATSALADDKPNVLFIAVDDLNDWISCLGGHPDCRTPNIDRLAKRGLLFERAYCAAPACNPSRAALMTGIHPTNSGVYVNPQPWRPVMPDVVTLPQHFMQHGYEAVGSGKIYHGRYEDRASWNDYLRKGGDPKPSAEVLKDPHSRAGGVVWGVLDVDDKDMNDSLMVDYALKYLKQPHQKPFFLACGIFRPHMPWQVPRKYYDRYPVDKVTLPKTIKGDLDDVPSAGVKMARPSGDHANVLKTDNWRYAVQAYLASIAFADAQIGRLLDAFDNSPHAKNTIIVLWGDHGWHLGEKQHWRKFSLWEEATRVPFMIVAPGVTSADTRTGRTVGLLDIYPTLCDLCGIPQRDKLDGKSLVPVLKNPQAPWDRPVLTTHGRNNHTIRDERWRYIRYADGSEELYDHASDPYEWSNLASKPESQSVKRKLAAWLPQHNAPDAPYDQALRKPKKTKTSKKKRKKSAN